MSSPTTNTLFLNLLSSAIWDKPADITLFKGVDTKGVGAKGLNAEAWKEIAKMARRQSVSALIADKALSLPKECLPPREQNLQFMVMIEQTQELNHKMIGVLSKIIQEYQAEDFQFCLLKGLANGTNYPKPLLRNAGDIDLLLYRKEDYERSKVWITGKGFEIEDESILHYKFEKEGIWIENHKRISYFDHKKYDKLFKEWEAELINNQNFTSIQIEELTVKQLPIEMNAFFIFQHLFRHFVHSGVGFRQICDWILFLSKHSKEIDPASFTAIAKSYELLYPMQLFARVAVKYLDAPQDIFPFEVIPDNEHVNWIISDILESGNFGFHRPGKKRPKEKLRGMWFSYKTIIRRSIKFGAISPQHSRILPVKRLINRLKIGFK